LSVLVVDDNRDGADSLADVLRAYGYEVRTAYTPTEAVIAVGDFAPDVVLMDIGIPGMDGYRLARRLCERLARRPRLVALTGYAGLEVRSRDEGFDAHFLKPADPADLAEALGFVVRRRPADIAHASPAVRNGAVTLSRS
jgi:CheY-like chemotaxis protein